VRGVRKVNKKEIGRKLKTLRNKIGYTAEKVGEDLNVSPSTVYMWESGNRTPDVFQLMILAEYYNVDLNHFDQIRSSDIDLNYISADQVKIPIIGEVRAGYDLLAEQNIIGYSYISKRELNGGEYFWLKVQGDSMNGAGIEEGDLVLVRRQPAVDEGQVAVVLIDNLEATIKRIYYGKEDQVILQSENPAHPPKVYEFKDIRILGLVKELKKEVK
jgi:repressor LexA